MIFISSEIYKNKSKLITKKLMCIKGDPDSKNKSEKGSAIQSGMASGCTSGLQSGARTPHCMDTPMMFSRRSTPSVGSLDSVDMPDNASESDPESRPISGNISPSDIPDSPGQQIQGKDKILYTLVF
jgi:hypothetical protein